METNRKEEHRAHEETAQTCLQSMCLKESNLIHVIQRHQQKEKMRRVPYTSIHRKLINAAKDTA